MAFRVNTLTLLVCGCLAGISGCGEAENKNQPNEMLNVPAAHAQKGQHGELLHNEATDEVTIYLLDGAATNPVAISAEQIAINIRGAEGAQQHFLKAQPAEGDPEDASSRFASTDKALAAALHDENATGQLVLTIQGKQFRGDIEHDHDHDHKH